MRFVEAKAVAWGVDPAAFRRITSRSNRVAAITCAVLLCCTSITLTRLWTSTRVATSDETIKSLKERLDARDDRIREQETAASSLREEIKEKDQELSEKDRKITQLTSKLTPFEAAASTRFASLPEDARLGLLLEQVTNHVERATNDIGEKLAKEESAKFNEMVGRSAPISLKLEARRRDANHDISSPFFSLESFCARMAILNDHFAEVAEFSDSAVGERIIWTGRVLRAQPFDEKSVYVVFASTNGAARDFATAYFPMSHRERVLALHKGALVRISGFIKMVDRQATLVGEGLTLFP